VADYYPLLARAVAALNPNSREQRYVLYERARKTLAEKLRAPALRHADLKAESAALEAAIQRIEMDTMRRAAPPRPKPAHEAYAAPAAGYPDRPPLRDTRRPLRILGGTFFAVLFLGAGLAIYHFWPRTLSEVRSIASPRSVTVAAEQSDAKPDYVRLRQLVYYRTNQPAGTIMVDKSQTFLYVVRPNMSALRYNIGVGTECTALAGLYHVVRKEELPGNQSQSGDTNSLGARVLYLDKNYRIHGSNPSPARLPSEGCIRLVNDDVIYLYDRTPLESRVVVSN